jgi:mono/diheme cytochrome c family protein
MALVSALLILATTSAGYGQENKIGADAFATACAVCHGSDAKGGGEFASVLTVKPPDLTTLKARNDGIYPYLDVFHIVDGRATLRAHGTSAMPIWGDTFKQEIGDLAGPFGSELLVRARITALVDYLESIQQ